jgi:hypothetical protein
MIISNAKLIDGRLVNIEIQSGVIHKIEEVQKSQKI